MDFKLLASFRNKTGISQREIAKILHVSKSTYARWETGEEIIPLKHLINFCNYFKISIDYAIGISKKNRYKYYDYTKKLNKKDIGLNIKKLRKRKKLTQKDLANVFNTSQSTISAYESGKTMLLTVFAYELAITYHISIDELCNLKKEILEKV